MELSRVERWILSNQFRILEALYPDEADYHRQNREAIERGFALHYNEAAQHVCDDEDAIPHEECGEVVAILGMFSAIKRSYDLMEDKSGIEAWTTSFSGFDGISETNQMTYARYFCGRNGGIFSELDKGDDFNSHAPTLDSYRRMLSEWANSDNKPQLSKEELIRITNARIHPDASQN